MARKSTQDLLDELEEQFLSVQKRIMTSKDRYLANHEKDYEKARDAYHKEKKKLEAASKRVKKEAEAVRKSGTKTAQNQLKKARAAAALLVMP